ncbi:MAG: heme transporter HemC [Alphaproteobacteria bacterium 41-28]|nr:MAG: heme transporter HemC [Alphaproteobacteria bacterium 41-28]
MKQIWARPSFFFKITNPIFPGVLILTGLLFAAGLYTGLLASPPDYQQGDAMRIMYIHVPASWMALFVYAFLGLMSLFILVWRHPLAEVLAVSAVPIGALFTILSLTTGSLWGKPMWGAYWVWDARLTSVLVLLFLYGGYWALYKAYSHPGQGIRAASLLALVGVINLPIIKGSVTWWNTLHQPASLTKLSSPSIHPTMLTPLILMAGAYFFYFVSVLILRTRTELNMRKLYVWEGMR